ncbi:MAG TPA: hypothetical protein VFF27_14485 [Bacteroidia bacterium]|jgi:hypothetical protein|nr:hypothetical protein [Bacteroidia bacterium]
MSSFLKKVVLFFSLCVLLSLIIVGGYMLKYHVSAKDFPSPPLSDSYSLNEKIEFLRTTPKTIQTLAIGSSIALNNLHSETVAKRVKEGNFLNTSSWGMNMGDNYSLLKTLYNVYHPNTLIIASSISEFELPAKKADYDKVEKYLTAGTVAANLYHVTCFNVRYYMDNVKYKKLVTGEKNQYEYLVFDQYGGVNISGEGFKIDPRRWEATFEKERMNDTNYDFVDSISAFCKAKNIKLLFFQSPFREGLVKKLDGKKTTELKEHMDRIAAILGRDQHALISADKILWNDALFIDGEHLSEKGAKAFTEYCFNQLDSLSLTH